MSLAEELIQSICTALPLDERGKARVAGLIEDHTVDGHKVVTIDRSVLDVPKIGPTKIGYAAQYLKERHPDIRVWMVEEL